MFATNFVLCGAGCALPRRCALASRQLDRVVGDSASQVGGRVAVAAGQTVFQGGRVLSLYLF
jgi:hypothetical protein